MCGIAGILSLGSTPIQDGSDLVVRMTRSLAHRGPDDQGIWVDEQAGLYLGHRRLSILDLSAEGHQPMVVPGGNVIVFNGEIYNFAELKRDLTGTAFRSTGDTEVLLRLFERDGPACIPRLNGMFAFANWDPRRRELFLARDRVGIKPLYYTTLGGKFAFASEIRALLLLPWVRRELDEESLHHFLTFNSVAPPYTLLKGVFKLPPGYQMAVNASGIVRYEAFWTYSPATEVPAGSAAAASSLLETLRQSVRSQMVSDVPVGTFLSGGVDSSAIVALMSEVADRPVRTFSIGFADYDQYDERRYAAAVARRFKAEHQERVVTRDELVGLLPRVAQISVDPVADPTMIPIYFLAEMARAGGTKVILTGDGSDELFAGYRAWLRYNRAAPVFRFWSGMPVPLRRFGRSVGQRAFEDGSVPSEFLTRAAKRREFFWASAGGFRESVKRTIMSSRFQERMAHLDLHAYVARRRRYFEQVMPPGRRRNMVDWMVYSGLTDTVPNQFMNRADRLGMAHSVEIRVPFLDNDVVDYGIAIPDDLKISGGEPKAILKEALRPILPPDVLYRTKQGFNVPLKEWMLGYVIDHLEKRVPAFCSATDLFDEQGVRNLVSRARNGAGNLAPSLWNVFFLMSWFEQWLLGPCPDEPGY